MARRAYAGWVIESRSPYRIEATREDHVLSLRGDGTLAPNQLARQIEDLIDAANRRMQTRGWQDWNKLRRAERDASRLQGRRAVVPIFEDPVVLSEEQELAFRNYNEYLRSQNEG